MKKWLVSILMVFFLLLVVAQSNSEAGIQFGIRGGGNAAKLTGPDITQEFGDTIKNKVGLVGGIFFAINIGRIITIEPEFLYTMKGVNFEDPEYDLGAKLSSDYLEIPPPPQAENTNSGNPARRICWTFGWLQAQRETADRWRGYSIG